MFVVYGRNVAPGRFRRCLALGPRCTVIRNRRRRGLLANTATYPVDLERPRQSRGGNVWQHLRSFRKRLFDAIPDDALRLDGAYVDLANDWAFMLPIVELAENPVHIAEPLYLHEPSGAGKGAGRAEHEATIGRIVAKKPA